MRIALIADPASPHTRVWVEAFAERGHEVALFSAHKQAPPTDLPARITAPLAARARETEPRGPGSPAAAQRAGGGVAPSAGPAAARGGARDPWKLRTITRAARLAPACRRWVHETRPDRLVALRFQPEGYLAAWSGQRPYALVSWGQDVLRFARGHPLHRALSRRAARRAALLLGETEPVVEALRGLAGTRAKRSGDADASSPERVAPRVERGVTGIDTRFWRPAQAGEREASRRALAAAHPAWGGWLERSAAGAPVILSPRSVDRHGHQRELLAAFALLVRAWDGTAPLLLQLGSGDPAERAYCAGRIAPLGLGGQAHDLGLLDRESLRRLFWLSDLAVSLWAPDGLSQTLLQAMACGVLPLCADIPGNVDGLDGGRAGLLVDPGDVAAIEERLRFALDHPEVRAAAASHGRSLVVARADRRTNMEHLVDLVLAM